MLLVPPFLLAACFLFSQPDGATRLGIPVSVRPASDRGPGEADLSLVKGELRREPRTAKFNGVGGVEEKTNGQKRGIPTARNASHGVPFLLVVNIFLSGLSCGIRLG